MNAAGWLVVLDSAGFSLMCILLSVLWQSSIILAIVGLLTYILRYRKKSIRCSLWLAAVLAVPVLPLLTWFISELGTPQAELPVIPSYSTIETRTIHIPSDIEHSPEYETKITEHSESNKSPVHKPFPSAHSTEQEQKISRISITAYPWALALTGYIIIVSIFIILIIKGRLRIRNWIISGEAVIDKRLIEIFEQVRKQLALSKEVFIFESDNVPGPLTCRIIRPVVLLPEGFTGKLSEAEVHAVAVHELTHIKRHDVLVLTAVSLIRAVFFFHPLVWLAARKISFLTEDICDDAVLDWRVESLVYAELLIGIAKNMKRRVLSTELASGIIFSKSMFFHRIETILSDRRDRIMKLSRWALIGTALVGLLSLLAAVSFPLVEARDDDDKIVVSGKVVHEGEPVRGAKMYFVSPKVIIDGIDKTGLVGKTKKDGSFTFTFNAIDAIEFYNRKRPPLNVVAYSERYALGHHLLIHKSNQKNIIIELGNPETVTGIVTDTKANPVQGAEVKINRLRFVYEKSSSEIKAVIPDMTQRTGKDGRFVLTNLPKGSFIFSLEIKGSGYAKETRSKIRAGDRDIAFTLIPEARIEGRVTYGNSGKPAKNVYVRATFGNIFPPSQITEIVKTDKNGFYTITNLLPDKHYSISIAQDYRFQEWTAIPVENLSVKEGKTTSNIDLQLIEGGIITGRISDKYTNEPIPNVPVCVIGPTNIIQPALTDEKGIYRIRFMPGNVKINRPYPPSYIISWESREVKVVDGEITGGIDFTFSKKKETDKSIKISHPITFTDTTSIEGRVIDEQGNPLSNVSIQMTSEDKIKNGSQLTLTVYTDDSGKYRLSNIPAGFKFGVSAKATGFRDGHITAFFTKKNMSPLDDIIMFKTDRWAEGTLTDWAGRPVVRAEVEIITGCCREREYTFTDAHGHFRINNLFRLVEPLVTINHKDYGSYQFLYITTNEIYNYTFVNAAHFIAGKVVDADNNPVEKVHVKIYPQRHKSGRIQSTDWTETDGLFRIDKIVDDSITVSYTLSGRNKTHYKKVKTNRDDVILVLTDEKQDESDYLAVLENVKNQALFLAGKPAPEISVSNWLNSDPVALKELKGNVVLLNFWTSEEVSSVEALDYIQALHRKFGKDVVFIGIHEYTADVAAIKKIIEEKGIRYRIAVDSKSPKQGLRGLTFDSYRFVKFPFKALIDRDGIVHISGYTVNKDDGTVIEAGFLNYDFDIQSKIRRLLKMKAKNASYKEWETALKSLELIRTRKKTVSE